MLARIALLVALVLCLSACSSSAPMLTLVDSKSPVQLLRNEAWFRLPEVMVKGDSETTDVSVACDSDPEGRLRLWTSSTVALVNNSFAPRVVGIADGLAESFSEQGWEADRAETDRSVLTVLTKPDNFVTIQVEAVEKTEARRATVSITTTGPCVMTAGGESDEVLWLEAVTN